MIELYATGQNLRFYSPVVAADSLNYLTAKVYFSDEWDGYTRWMHFKKGDIVYDIELNEDDEITEDDSLNLVVGEWEIYAHGTMDEARLTTVPVILTVKESGLIDGPLHVLPQTVAEQLDYKASQSLLVAQAVKDAADRGDFNGKDGKSFAIVGYFDTYEELVATVTEPVAGEMYGVGTEIPYYIYAYDFINNQWVNNGSIQGPEGPAGETGVTFTPSVSDSGYISWTNDGGLPNPPTKNIAGPQGTPGSTGPTGKSAYAAAVEGGYTGTEATFNTAMSAFPYHNARHLPTGADPILVKSGNLEDGSVTKGKIAAHAVSDTYTATLNTTWSGSEAPYSKAQTISGILASDNPIIDLVPSSTYATAQQQEEAWASIYRIVASANTLTFYAHEKPTVSLPIKIQCIRK